MRTLQLKCFILSILLVLTGYSPNTWGCGGSPQPPSCFQTAWLAKFVPGTVVFPGSGSAINIPVGVLPFVIWDNTTVGCAQPAAASISLTLTCTPAMGGSPIVIGPQTFTLPTPTIPGPQPVPGGPLTFTIPAGTLPASTVPYVCAITGQYNVSFAGGIGAGVLTGSGDTEVCIVDPAPEDPSIPRLNMEYLDLNEMGFQTCRRGDQAIQYFLIENNDPNESVSLTFSGTNTQVARMPEFTPSTDEPATVSPDEILYRISADTGDSYPIAFVDGTGVGDLLLLPSDPGAAGADEVEISQSIALGPYESTIVPIYIRSHGMCADGSCVESVAKVVGTFSDGTPALGCAGTALLVGEGPTKSPLCDVTDQIVTGPTAQGYWTAAIFDGDHHKSTFYAGNLLNSFNGFTFATFGEDRDMPEYPVGKTELLRLEEDPNSIQYAVQIQDLEFGTHFNNVSITNFPEAGAVLMPAIYRFNNTAPIQVNYNATTHDLMLGLRFGDAIETFFQGTMAELMESPSSNIYVDTSTYRLFQKSLPPTHSVFGLEPSGLAITISENIFPAQIETQPILFNGPDTTDYNVLLPNNTVITPISDTRKFNAGLLELKIEQENENIPLAPSKSLIEIISFNVSPQAINTTAQYPIAIRQIPEPEPTPTPTLPPHTGDLLTREQASTLLLSEFEFGESVIWSPYVDFGFGEGYFGLMPQGATAITFPQVWEPMMGDGIPIGTPHYLFWADDDQFADFAHSTRLLLVNATMQDPTVGNGGIVVSEREWWPGVIINNETHLYFDIDILRTSTNPAGANNPEGLIYGNVPTEADIVIEDPDTGTEPSEEEKSESWGIVINGSRDAHHKNNADQYEKDLKEHYGVPGDNIIRLDPQDATPEKIAAAIVELCESNEVCDKIFIRITSHGGRGGRLVLDGIRGTISAEALCELLKPLGTKTFEGEPIPICTLINACYSGQMLDDEGWGYPPGSMFITSALNVPSYWSPQLGYSFFPYFFSECLNSDDPAVDTNQDGMVDDGEAYDWVIARGTEIVRRPEPQKRKVEDPDQPTVTVTPTPTSEVITDPTRTIPIEEPSTTSTPTPTFEVIPEPTRTFTIITPTLTRTPTLSPTPRPPITPHPQPTPCVVYFSIEEPNVLPNGGNHGDILVHNPGGLAYPIPAGKNEDLLDAFLVRQVRNYGLDGFDIIELDTNPETITTDDGNTQIMYRHKILFTTEENLVVTEPNHPLSGTGIGAADILSNQGGVILNEAFMNPLNLITKSGIPITRLGIDALEVEGLLPGYDAIATGIFKDLPTVASTAGIDLIKFYISFEEVNQEFVTGPSSVLTPGTLISADDVIQFMVTPNGVSASISRSGQDGVPDPFLNILKPPFGISNNMGLDAIATCLDEDFISNPNIVELYFSTSLNDDLQPIEFTHGDMMLSNLFIPMSSVTIINPDLVGNDERQWGLDGLDLYPERIEPQPTPTPTATSTNTPEPTDTPTATPTPTTTPTATSTNTPVPIRTPTVTPTPERPTPTNTPPCPTRTPLIVLSEYEFDRSDLNSSGWREIPGGFIKSPNENGEVSTQIIPANLIPSSADGLGLSLKVSPNEVAFIHTDQPIDTDGKAVIIRVTLRALNEGATFALVVLKGNLTTGASVDGSIATHIPANLSSFTDSEKRLVLVYQPDNGELITPALQLASTSSSITTTVIVDKLEVIEADQALLGSTP